MSDFARNIRKWSDKTGRHIDDTIRAVVLDLSAKIIARTPVDTGRARGNWQAATGQPASGTLGMLDPSGGAATAAAALKAKDAPGRIYYLTNNLPYIRRLEYDGYSSQAPNGFVRVTVAEFKQALSNAVKTTG